MFIILFAIELLFEILKTGELVKKYVMYLAGFVVLSPNQNSNVTCVFKAEPFRLYGLGCFLVLSGISEEGTQVDMKHHALIFGEPIKY